MHQINNEDTRKLMKLCTIHSTLRERRIKWIQNNIAHHAENEQLRAAVCGLLTKRTGTITAPYKAWLQIILEDILEPGSYPHLRAHDRQKSQTPSSS